MNKLGLAAAVCALSSTGAFAADLPSRLPPPVYAPPLPVFTWTGVYVGATAGYAFNTDHDYGNIDVIPGTGFISNNAAPGFARSRGNGFTGGGEIGYNYQIANTAILGRGGIVTGIEADAEYVGPGNTTAVTSVFPFNSSFHGRTEFVGTVRGRLGYAFDNLLVYGTGGFAYGGVKDSIQFNLLNIPANIGTRSTLSTGYAYGGGVAYALPAAGFLNVFHASSVILKAEYIHYDLGSSSTLVSGLALPTVSRIKVSGDLVRAGIDFKFDSYAPLAPIVAKY